MTRSFLTRWLNRNSKPVRQQLGACHVSRPQLFLERLEDRVQPSTVTSTTLVASPLATTGGTLVALTATVTPSPGAVGTISFLDNGISIPGGANVPIVGGVAAISTSWLNGNHPLTAAYTGNGDFLNSISNPQTVFVTVSPTPRILSITPNGASVAPAAFFGDQRSRVVGIDVRFDRDVQVDPGAFTLALHTKNVSFGGVALPFGSLPTSLDVNPFNNQNNIWSIKFLGNTEVGADGLASLKDGVYDLIVNGAKIHAAGVDLGDNSTTMTFYRLFGETNKANSATGGTQGVDFVAIVNTADGLVFNAALNNPPAYKPYLDFDGDGLINGTDNVQYQNRRNIALTWTADSVSVGTGNVVRMDYAAADASVTVTTNGATGTVTGAGTNPATISNSSQLIATDINNLGNQSLSFTGGADLTLSDRLVSNGIEHVSFTRGVSTNVLVIDATNVNSSASATINVATAASFVVSGTSSTLSGVMSGAGSFSKNGPGTLVVGSNNTYTGATEVNAGTLTVTGALSSPVVNVNSGGTLGGGGAVHDVVVYAGGRIFPGDNGDIIKVGNLSMAPKSILEVNLNGVTPETRNDEIDVTGIANLDTDAGTSPMLDVNVRYTPMPGDSFTVINNDGSDTIRGIFAGLPEGGTLYADGFAFTITYTGGVGNNDVRLIAKAAPSVGSVTSDGNITGLEGPQGSRVASLVVAFDQPVQLDANALSLTLHTSGVVFGGEAKPAGMGAVPTNLVSSTGDNITYTITFTGAGTVETGTDGISSLKDGVYDLVINAAKVHPVFAPRVNMAANQVKTFHRLFGDTDLPTGVPNGAGGTIFSAVVNTGDNLAFRTAFNRPVPDYLAYLDFDGSGLINTGDNLEFRNRFNKTLTWSV
jgi:autotransporter-associated beta strand protein